MKLTADWSRECELYLFGEEDFKKISKKDNYGRLIPNKIKQCVEIQSNVQ